MSSEFEVVSNPQFRNLHVFLVHMRSRAPHIHRELEIGYVLQGKIDLRIDRGFGVLNPLDGYIINPLDPHEFYSHQEDAIILAVQISPRIFESFFTEIPTLRYAGGLSLRRTINDGRDYGRLLRSCLNLARTYANKKTEYEFDCFEITASLLATLNRTMPRENISNEALESLSRRRERMIGIMNYIDENCHRKLLLEELAFRENLTMPHLSHLFRDTLGITFQDYIKKKRFEYARALIMETDRTLLDISMESGFSDTRYMIRMFQEEFGCTPKQYRKNANSVSKKRITNPGNDESILDPTEVVALLNSVESDLIE